MRRLFFALCLVSAAGCGSGTVKVTSESVTPPAAPAARELLEGVAESGAELGSSAMSIREELEKLKATDEAKATELLNDLTQLEGMTDAAQIKQKAKEMAGKL